MSIKWGSWVVSEDRMCDYQGYPMLLSGISCASSKDILISDKSQESHCCNICSCVSLQCWLLLCTSTLHYTTITSHHTTCTWYSQAPGIAYHYTIVYTIYHYTIHCIIHYTLYHTLHYKLSIMLKLK